MRAAAHDGDSLKTGFIGGSGLKRVARASGRGANSASVIGAAAPPWEGFRADVQRLVERCVARHRPDHFTVARDRREQRGTGMDITSGSLHNDTAYGIVDGPDDKGQMTVVETKSLDVLDPGKLGSVRDHALRSRLQAMWERVETEQEGESDRVAWQRFCGRAWQQHRVRRVRVLLRLGEESLAFVRDNEGRAYKAYKTDGNAYMDVWLLPNGRTRGETVSRFNAHQPDFRSGVKKEYPTARKLMRLQINDMIAAGAGDERRLLRVQFLSGQSITAVDHNEGGDIRARVRISDHSERYLPLRVSASRVIQAGLRKVAVDVLGRVQDGGRFGPDGRGRSGRG